MAKNKTNIITGAAGFIGLKLCETLAQADIQFLAVTRHGSIQQEFIVHQIAIGDINSQTDWSNVLSNIDSVIHLAARVHVMKDNSQDPLTAFRSMNVEGTLNLARQAAKAGVQRFIFLSSIKVNGEQTNGKPFKHLDEPAPVDPYGISKLEAERGLQKISQDTGLEVVIIRPPLVYGKNAGGNFARLRKLAAKGWPLPLGAVNNKRSLIGIDNLCDCIKICLDHPAATRHPLLVSDNHDISTPELIRLLATSAGRPIILPALPLSLLKAFATIAGRGQEIQRLVSNLQVDCTETMRLLNWVPPISLTSGIKASVATSSAR